MNDYVISFLNAELPDLPAIEIDRLPDFMIEPLNRYPELREVWDESVFRMAKEWDDLGLEDHVKREKWERSIFKAAAVIRNKFPDFFIRPNLGVSYELKNFGLKKIEPAGLEWLEIRRLQTFLQKIISGELKSESGKSYPKDLSGEQIISGMAQALSYQVNDYALIYGDPVEAVSRPRAIIIHAVLYYLIYFLLLKDNVWKKIRHCVSCRKYFFVKTQRGNPKYCSRQCRIKGRLEFYNGLPHGEKNPYMRRLREEARNTFMEVAEAIWAEERRKKEPEGRNIFPFVAWIEERKNRHRVALYGLPEELGDAEALRIGNLLFAGKWWILGREKLRDPLSLPKRKVRRDGKQGI